MAALNKNLIARLFSIGMKFRKWFLFTILLSLVLAAVSTYRPYLTMLIVDEDISKHADRNAMLNHIYLLLGLVVFESFFNLFFVYASNNIAQLVIRDIRERLFAKLIYFRASYFDTTPVGQLVTRSVSDVETIATVYKDGFLMIFGDILRIVFVLVMMFAMDVQMSLISLLLLPIMYFITKVFQKKLKSAFGEERSWTAIQNSFVQERLSGMSVIQVFNREKAEFSKFEKINATLESALLRTVFIFSIFFPVVELVSSVFLGLILFYGGWVKISAGVIIAFIQYINMLVRPLRQIADRFNNIQRGLVGAERVFGVIDEENEMPNEGTIIPKSLEGKISFDNVIFSYDGEMPVLKGVSFEAKPGETIAIVGATGAGKTTIISLLTRLYDRDSGTISIDNVDIRNYELYALRKKIGVVIQDVFLFHGTIRENLTLEEEDIPLERIRNAAAEIGIDKFINSLPGGYDFVVSERGAALSLGQRQLLSFLRVYLSDPDLLILDEATSSIDVESEKLIQNATEKLTRNRTAIIIAHRLSTIENADKILVMHQGRVAEMGTHAELLKKKSYYYALYNSQEFHREKSDKDSAEA